jgi:hypothetical protein
MRPPPIRGTTLMSFNRQQRRAFAKALKAKGLSIFRIKHNNKEPVATGWQDEALIADVKQWENGQSFNIGVATGGTLLVIDIDMKKGKDGETAWAALCKEHDIDESQFQIATPNGGRHLYYSVPDGLKLKNSASKIATGVDVRGKGGFVVGPGSSISEGTYTVINIGAEIMEMPQALIDLCGRARKRDDEYDVPVGDLDTEENIGRAKQYLKGNAPLSVEGDGGDQTAFAVAARVRDMGVSEEMCADLMAEDWNDRCSPPWSGDELSVKVSNAYRYATGRIGGDTAEAQFADEPDSEPLAPLKPRPTYNAKTFAAFLESQPTDDINAVIDAFICTVFTSNTEELRAEKAATKALGMGQNINAFRKDVAAAQKRHGSRATKRKLSASKETALAEGQWPINEPLPSERFPFYDEGKLLAHEENYAFMLKAYGIDTGYDMISKEIFGLSQGLDTETDNAQVALFSRIKSLAALNGLPGGNDTLHTFLPAIADAQQVNRVRDYLGQLKWDNQDRFRKLANSLGSHDLEIALISIQRWCIQACAAADGAELARKIDPSKKAVFEYVLVMRSDQGDGKTKGLMDITPKALKQYLKESVVLNANNKDSVKQSVSCWIAELGELDATFKAADHVAFKAFMSREYDELRMPYAPTASRFRRRTVFFGSVNEPEFLKDKTGGRRFFPLSVDRGFPAWPDGEVDQLWAQAWALYANGEQWWPTSEEAALLNANAELFREKSWIEEALETKYDWTMPPAGEPRLKASAIIQDLPGPSSNRMGPRDISDVGHALRRLWADNGAYKKNGDLFLDTPNGSVKVNSTGGKNKGWLLPPELEDDDFAAE